MADHWMIFGMDERARVRRLLSDCYTQESLTLRPLRSAVERSVYRVRRTCAPDWVLRIDRGERAWSDTMDRAAVLLFLNEYGYPAPEVVPTVTGKPAVRVDGESILVTSFVPGKEGRYTPTQLYLLAESVAKLHALDLDDRDLNSLPETQWRPEAELRDAIQLLIDLEPVVPKHLCAWHARLLCALRPLDGLGDAPRAVMHTDISPANAIFTEREVVLIDWDGAGLGPAFYDLAWLLASADGDGCGGFWPDASRIEAIISGYTKHRVLSRPERELLSDAVRLGPAVDATKNFVAHLQGRTGEEAWQRGWARYEAASEVVDIAQRCLNG